MRPTLAAPLLWTAFVLLPIDGWALLDGVPLGVLDAVVLFTVWWAWAVSRRLAGAPIVAAALVLKFALAPFLIERGFSASYFANESFQPPVERSVEYRGGDATRVDPRLAFGGDGLPDLPLFFFDDFRFNFYQRGEPRRSELPFSVVWDGYAWEGAGERSRAFYLKGSQASARLEIDGATVLEMPAGAGAASVEVLYPRGWRRIVVRLSAAQGAARDFAAGAAGQPFGSTPIYRAPVSRTAMYLDRAARIISIAIDLPLLLMLAWAAVGALRRSWPAAVAVIAMAEAVWFAAPAAGRLILQPGGDDSLTYQAYARDIVMNGPLMLMGAPAGQAEPFYYQPLYSYFLAAVHLLFGDDLFGLYFLQRLSLALVTACVWWITDRLYGRGAARAAVLLALPFLYWWVDPWARTLWTEVLFVALVSAWTCLLIRVGSLDVLPAVAVAAGAVGGAAVLTRSTLLLALAIVPLLLLWGRRRARAALAPVLVMLAVAAAVVSLATLRNWIASGRAVPITTSFGINLYLGNAPPAPLPVHDGHAIYRLLGGDARTRQVIEYAVHDPASFLANLFDKALYTFGYFDRLVSGAGASPVLMAIWIAALAGIIAAARMPSAALLAPWTRAVPAAVALCLFASVILIFPTHFRLILPGYVLLLPYVAALAARPWTRA